MKKEDRIKETGWTYEDYTKLPDDGNRYEITGGRLELLTPSPSSEHQMVSIRLSYLLMSSCSNEYIILEAPIDVIFADDEIRQPDLLMVHFSRESIVSKRGVEGPPDLIVEILSPGTAIRDRFIKSEIYAKYGVKEYWIVDMYYRTVEQYLLDGKTSKYTFHSAYGETDEVTSPNINCVRYYVKQLFQKGNPLAQQK
ncbi:Uma2 family endonuclease [Microaerobacter geothermalis]|uniref:Uma2 family endonuclease n=1 Tax=Microaerobacter geothermalis TaxID=674972 RepID=UPI001F2567B3|nr:Uma2 family endonuclease [Microaerobacter geothermalis]MCF6093433.1 Uma2 family endonuclease [Microaerobacter geothermalis]